MVAAAGRICADAELCGGAGAQAVSLGSRRSLRVNMEHSQLLSKGGARPAAGALLCLASREFTPCESRIYICLVGCVFASFE